MSDYELIQGDCLEEMWKLGDQSVNLILADLPYGTTACEWDSVIPLEPLWEQFRRLLVPVGAVVLTASQPFTTALINSNPEWFKYCWVWDKTVAGDIFNAKNKPLKRHEDICVFSQGTTANGSDRKMVYNPQGLKPIRKQVRNKETVRAFFAPRPSHKDTYTQEQTSYPTSVLFYPNETGLHPTQKPVPLMDYLIRTYTNPGDLVLDPTMGSGTTGVAALQCGRRFIGIEKDEEYFRIAQRRMSKIQPDLFELAASSD